MFAVCRIATVYIIRALKKKTSPHPQKIIPSQSICSYTLPPRARIPIPDRRTRPHSIPHSLIPSFPLPPTQGPQKRLPPSMIIVTVARKTLRPHRASPELRQTTQIRIDRSSQPRPPSMYHTPSSRPGPGEGRGCVVYYSSFSFLPLLEIIRRRYDTLRYIYMYI